MCSYLTTQIFLRCKKLALLQAWVCAWDFVRLANVPIADAPSKQREPLGQNTALDVRLVLRAEIFYLAKPIAN
jgi:hypothetical protein